MWHSESLQEGVPIGTDRDPSYLVFSRAISFGCGSFGWTGPRFGADSQPLKAT
jgi:hypothetical protein